MQENFSSKHNIAANCSGILLNSSYVSDEGGSHLETPWWNVTDSSLNIVRDPLDKVGVVLVLDVEHLLVHLLHGHAEKSSNCEISAVPGHKHKPSFKHLLGQLISGLCNRKSMQKNRN
jgi:hypothetical protein